MYKRCSKHRTETVKIINCKSYLEILLYFLKSLPWETLFFGELYIDSSKDCSDEMKYLVLLEAYKVELRFDEKISAEYHVQSRVTSVSEYLDPIEPLRVCSVKKPSN